MTTPLPPSPQEPRTPDSPAAVSGVHFALLLAVPMAGLGVLAVWALRGEQQRAVAAMREEAERMTATALTILEKEEPGLEKRARLVEMPGFPGRGDADQAAETALRSRFTQARDAWRAAQTAGEKSAARRDLLALRAEPAMATAVSAADVPLLALVLRLLCDAADSADERAGFARELADAARRRPGPLTSRLLRDAAELAPGAGDGDPGADALLEAVATAGTAWSPQHPWREWRGEAWFAGFPDAAAGLVPVTSAQDARQAATAAWMSATARGPERYALGISWQGRPLLPADGDLLTERRAGPWQVTCRLPPGVSAAAVAARDTRRLAFWLGGGLALAALALWAIWRAFRREALLRRLQAEFVASVSHELRTPVASIGVMAERLHEGRVTDPAQAERYHRAISREGRRLAALVDNVLDFSRIGSGRQQYEFADTDLPRLVTETCALLRPFAEARGQTLEVAVSLTSEDPVPPVDGLAIRRALVNLLDNAIKFTPEGGSLGVGLAPADGGGVILTVRDSGPGIPPGLEKRIFERFFRADNGLTRETGGAGIGLSLVHHIVTAHGGTVRVNPGGPGAIFTVHLPPS